jgi:hypothetical protein
VLVSAGPFTLGATNLDFVLQNDVVGPARIVRVAKTGSTYLSIQSALAAVSADATNPCVIEVSPGTYIENNPIACKDYVSIRSAGTDDTVVVQAANANQHLFVMASQMLLCGMHLSGASGAGKAGVYIGAGETGIQIERVGFESCIYGILTESAANNVEVTHCVYHGGSGTAAYAALAGGRMVLLACHATAGATLAYGILSSGGGSSISSTAGTFTGTGTGKGIGCTVWGMVQSNGDYVTAWDDCLHIAANGGVLIASGTCTSQSTTYDIHTEGVGTLYAMNAAARVGKIDIHASTAQQGNIVSSEATDEGTHYLGEFSIGYFTHGVTSFFGHGNPHYHGMKIFTNTNLEVGAWVDNTTAFVNGVPTDLFAGNGVGNCLYVGGDDDFTGVWIDVVQALVLGMGGSVARGYWNGATWAALPGMTANPVTLEQYANSTCERVATEFINYGDMTGWTPKNLNGSTKKWIRLEITGAITTIPKLTTIRLLQHSSQHNEDGVILRHGRSRIQRDFATHWTLFDTMVGAAPGSHNLDFSANVQLVRSGNMFVNGAVDGKGTAVQIPTGLDTSLPVTITVTWLPHTIPAGGDQIELESYYVRTTDGSLLAGALAEKHAVKITACPAAANQRTTTVLTLDVSTYLPGDTLAATVFRDATAGNPDDTYGNNIIIESVKVVGWIWR